MSRLKCDYSHERYLLEVLGGLEVYREVEAQVDALQLPECPFCGGEAVVTIGSMYMHPSVAAECSSCHNTTMRYAAGYDLLRKCPVTIFDAVDRVAARWSRRKEQKT